MNYETRSSQQYARIGTAHLLERLPADVAGSLMASTADVALVVDPAGIIQEVAFNSDDFADEDYDQWRGKAWVDTVTVESRAKVSDLLAQAGGNSASSFREINHPSKMGLDLPIRYSAIRMSDDGAVVAVGRDLRKMSQLQQRLVETQQAMEREYARLRLAETRYRMLFQVTSEPVVIVDTSSLRIVEANPAAQRLLGEKGDQIIGQALHDRVIPTDLDPLKAMLSAARINGRGYDLNVTLTAETRPVTVAASLFRKDQSSFLLIRLIDAQVGERNGSRQISDPVRNVLEQLPDGFVVVDAERRIVEVNQAFLDLAQLASKKQALGEPLDRFLGRPGVDLPLVMQGLDEHGTVYNFSTVMVGQFGSQEDVEVSAVAARADTGPTFGFVVRNVSRRTEIEGHRDRALPRSVERLTELVGRVPLKDLVRETTDVIEKLCIEAALELSKDNRASAAQMLGLSRQSLYAKLRRFGLGDLDDADEILS
jgi:transcriptional regulator PpsR